MKIKQTTPADIAALQNVLDQTDLFPSEMLPDMFSDPESDTIWLTVEYGDTAIGFCSATPEMLTDGAWNMQAIAIHPDHQGKGLGGALVAHLEKDLRAQGARILIADTSGTEDFAQTRAFYTKNAYVKEATIRDFWGKGDDKITYWKSLT